MSCPPAPGSGCCGSPRPPRFAVQQSLPQLPAGQLRLHAGERLLPARALGRLRRALRLRRARPGSGRLAAAPEGRMRPALHAEWTKLRTVAGTGWLLLATIVLTVAVSAVATAARGTQPAGATSRHHQAQPHRDRPRPGDRRHSRRARDQQRVRHRHDPHHPGGDAAPVHRPGRQGSRRRWPWCSRPGPSPCSAPCSSGGSSCPATASPRHTATRCCPLRHGPTLRAAVGSVLYLVLIALLSLGVATAVRDARRRRSGSCSACSTSFRSSPRWSQTRTGSDTSSRSGR